MSLGFVTFVHPDGRLLPAVITAHHKDSVVDLVVFEGATAPFGGTSVFEGVNYSDAAPGQESARHTWMDNQAVEAGADVSTLVESGHMDGE